MGTDFSNSARTAHRTRSFLVIGGGLAGLTAALELSKAGNDVTVLEASSRLGGKAGADYINGRYEEHGLHLFPPWYVNTFRLARELGVAPRLVPICRIHELRRGEFPRLHTLDRPTSLRSVLPNTIFGRVFPWRQAVPLYAAVLQLAAAADDPNSLDHLSIAAFFASCAEGLPEILSSAEAIIPKLLGVSTADLSAFAWQTAIRYWLRYRTPVFFIFNGNLQQSLIEPFARDLQSRGCRLLLNCHVERLLAEGKRATGAVYRLGTERVTQTADACVLATPPDVSAHLLHDHREALRADCRGIGSLEARPMGTMSLYLKRPLTSLPREHVMLKDSQFALGLIDVSQVWGGFSGSVLCLNIGNVFPILDLSSEEAAKCVFREVAEYLPIQWTRDVAHSHIRTNADAPLFLTNPGSWANRPSPGRTGLAGLYVCGDYCRSAVRLVSVEGAISSGLTAAAEALRDCGEREIVSALEPESPSALLVGTLSRILGYTAAVVNHMPAMSRQKKAQTQAFDNSQVQWKPINRSHRYAPFRDSDSQSNNCDPR